MKDKNQNKWWKVVGLLWILSTAGFLTLYYGFDAHFKGDSASPLGYVAGFLLLFGVCLLPLLAVIKLGINLIVGIFKS